jgi:hypothetical protein
MVRLILLTRSRQKRLIWFAAVANFADSKISLFRMTWLYLYLRRRQIIKSPLIFFHFVEWAPLTENKQVLQWAPNNGMGQKHAQIHVWPFSH